MFCVLDDFPYTFIKETSWKSEFLRFLVFLSSLTTFLSQKMYLMLFTVKNVIFWKKILSYANFWAMTSSLTPNTSICDCFQSIWAYLTLWTSLKYFKPHKSVYILVHSTRGNNLKVKLFHCLAFLGVMAHFCIKMTSFLPVLINLSTFPLIWPL